MQPATELAHVSTGLCFWQRYDANVKAELFSTAVETAAGILLVDPIPLQEEVLADFIGDRAVAGIFVTNANHGRSATKFAEISGAPLFAHAETCAVLKLPLAKKIADGQKLTSETCAIEIEGAAPGELAVHCDRDGGAIIIGDALINFEPYGFTFLPAKYCSNAKQMRRSLRRLLDYDFERMFFAHGTPLVSSARKRLDQLLGNSD